MSENLTNRDILQQAEATVRLAEKRARNFYDIQLPDAKIDFSLRGRCAGQARVDRNGDTCLRINLQLLTENLDDFLNNTIPHEVSHLVVNWQARQKNQRPSPHGAEWRAVMQCCFDLEPKRCHSYRTTPARIVRRPFLYICSCRKHLLTSIMHNRISRSHQALCKVCRTQLEFVSEQKR